MERLDIKDLIKELENIELTEEQEKELKRIVEKMEKHLRYLSVK